MEGISRKIRGVRLEMDETAPSSGWEARKSSGENAEPGLSTRDEAREGPARSRGPWRRVALSDRDWEVLSWAHEQKFLMFDQVAQWFPQGAANPHSPPKETPTPGTLRRRARPGNWYVLERLRKLVRFDVLRRVPVYTEAAGALLPGRLGFDLLVGSARSSRPVPARRDRLEELRPRPRRHGSAVDPGEAARRDAVAVGEGATPRAQHPPRAGRARGSGRPGDGGHRARADVQEPRALRRHLRAIRELDDAAARPSAVRRA